MTTFFPERKNMNKFRFSIVAMLLVIMGFCFAGCQMELNGPSVKASIYQKNENNGEVWKSRMSGGSTSTGPGTGSVWAWGNGDNK
jgi:hypothetical protein